MGWFSNVRAPTQRSQPATYVAGAYGFGAPFHQVFSFHPLPEAGAMQYSYDTLCLPRYSPIGNGPGNRAEFVTIGSCMQPLHGVHLTAIGSPGVLTGQFVGQPILNVTTPSGAPGEQAAVGTPALPQTVDNTFSGITLNPGQYQLPA